MSLAQPLEGNTYHNRDEPVMELNRPLENNTYHLSRHP
jgi:hypothetical protein